MRYFLLAAAASLFVVSSGIGANLAVNPGFETMETTSGGWPGSYGHWNGDYSAIVGETGGITPYEGNSMLQFKGTSFNGAGSATTCQVYQLIDITQYASLVSDGQATVKASALFNRVQNSDTQFGITIYAMPGNPSDFSANRSQYYDIAPVNFSSDNDTNSWEACSAQLLLPSQTNYIAVLLGALEDVDNDYSYPEFDGHFADAVSVEIVPEPATIAFLLSGFIILKKKRHDR